MKPPKGATQAVWTLRDAAESPRAMALQAWESSLSYTVKRGSLAETGDRPFMAADKRMTGPSKGAFSLFAGREAGFSFNTRVAIRRSSDLLGLAPGDEVLAPAYNCGSELDPLRHAGLTTKLYPVGRDTTVDPEAVETSIGPKTRAVYLTHYFGFLQPETLAIRALCDAHGLRLIEDCALSLLSGDRPAEGRAGDISVFCFYKFFPVFAGGALVLNAPDLDHDVRFDRPPPTKQVAKEMVKTVLEKTPGLHGMLKRARGTREDPVVGSVDHPDMPSHYYFDPRLRDARMATLTRRGLEQADVACALRARRRNYQRMRDQLDGIAGLSPLFPDLPSEVVPMNMPILVAGGHRDALAQASQAEGIEATAWWSGYHRDLDFSAAPDACWLKDHILGVPIDQSLGPAEIDHIAARLRVLHATLGNGC